MMRRKESVAGTCLVLVGLWLLLGMFAAELLPAFKIKVQRDQMRAELGHAFQAVLPFYVDAGSGTVTLYEDGKALGPSRNVYHSRIREEGGGLFAQPYDNTLYFSSTDGTDPNSNGRKYQWRLEG